MQFDLRVLAYWSNVNDAAGFSLA